MAPVFLCLAPDTKWTPGGVSHFRVESLLPPGEHGMALAVPAVDLRSGGAFNENALGGSLEETPASQDSCPTPVYPFL